MRTPKTKSQWVIKCKEEGYLEEDYKICLFPSKAAAQRCIQQELVSPKNYEVKKWTQRLSV